MGSFAGPTLPTWAARLREGGLGSVCLFGSNIPAYAGVRALSDAVHSAGADVLVATDEEGGDVTRLYTAEGSPVPGNAALGAVDEPSLTRRVAASVGSVLAAAGIDLDLAPVVDVNSDPRNPVIGVRSFGADPALVARHTTAYVEGLQSAGVGACAKHFPGHGDTAVDSHLGLPTVDVGLDVLLARELVPFAAAVRAGTLAVMTSHVLLPALDADRPATLSPAVLGLLRGELGFDGLLVSDAVDMAGASAGRGEPAAAVLALAAGCDLV
jgi:beta-N-acetylhexosaminidase